MYVVVNGADVPTVPFDTITFTGTVGDPSPPHANFDIWDQGGLLSFDVQQEVIIWDENAQPINLGATPSPPSQNYLINPVFAFGTISSATNWTDASGGHITYPSNNAVLTFSNLAVGAYYIYQQTLRGYIHPGVQYMLSVYALEASLVNGNAFIAIQFQDASGNTLSTNYNTFTPTTANTRYNVSVIAPANAMFIVAQMGGNATNSTNSGTITFSTMQLEPMWFANGANYPVPVSYPTPDLNFTQVSCYLLPDNTCSRYARLFAGYIDDWQTEWDGKLRIWHISCAGSSATLDDGEINGTFTAQYDDQILGSVINTYFNNVIALTAPNSFAPSPVVRGVLVDSQNYTDNTLREVLNGLTDLSGDMYYLDPYYRLFKNPPFYNASPFAFSDAISNPVAYGSGSYGSGPYSAASLAATPYYDYLLEKDGTQRRRKVKVIGGKSGSTVQVSQVLDQDANNAPLAPAYAIRGYDAKVNDTNLISTVTTTTRGLAEVSKFGSPKMIITCKSQKYVPQGFIIYFTATLDNIINQPYVVQQVQGSMKGGPGAPGQTAPLNEFAYTLGYFTPTLLDHIRNANKALNRGTVLTGVNNILAYDLSVREPIVYSEIITLTPGSSTSAGVYGTAKYAGNSYS